MKLTDLTHIPDPYARFVQSMKFIRSLKMTEQQAAEIRDKALLELRDPENKKRPTQTSLATLVGVKPQRINNMEKLARSRYE